MPISPHVGEMCGRTRGALSRGNGQPDRFIEHIFGDPHHKGVIAWNSLLISIFIA
ncbi:hypothetical protein [Mesorhizobium sp.]|uniref:hypothetical protein n=1 Tax=Mesorhizobium sp. TaxID=1871066 RepID=UPI00257B6C2C|nr:hypothetical protein [Mesorhizobium sp.]